MTWLTTWPKDGKPQYAPHATEAKAEKHAEELVRSGRAAVAVCFEIEGLEIAS